MALKEKPPLNVSKTGIEGVDAKKVIKKLLQNEPPPFNERTGLIGRRPKQPRVIVGAEEAIAKKAELEDKIAHIQKTITTLEGMLENSQLSKNERSGIRLELLFKKTNLRGLYDKLSKLTTKLGP